MNDMRKLMEAVQLNEYYINNTFTWGKALEEFQGDPEDTKYEKEYLADDGWGRAVELLKTVERMHKETETQLRKLGLYDELLPEHFVSQLDQQATAAFDHIGLPGDESEEDYIRLNIEERLNGMEMLSNMAEDPSEPEYDMYGEPITEEYSTVANDEVEDYLEKAAKALAKDAVIQSAGVYDDEGPGRSGAASGRDYIKSAAPGFLDEGYKAELMAAFDKYFHEYVDYFIEYVAGERK